MIKSRLEIAGFLIYQRNIDNIFLWILTWKIVCDMLNIERMFVMEDRNEKEVINRVGTRSVFWY